MTQIKELLEQIRKSPGRGELHNSVARLYQLKGDNTEAIKHFMAAARLFAGPDSRSRNVNKAIAILRKMTRDFPFHHDSYYLLAEILQEMDNQEEAVGVFSALSDLYGRDGKHLMAVSVFDKVISSKPDDQGLWVKFANLNRDAGMPFHAAQAFVKAASLGLQMKKGELPAGLVIQALELDPENVEAHELFRNLAGRGMTGQQQEERILSLSDELDKSGQYDQALSLLDLLKGTGLQEKAEEAAASIMKHSGLVEEETGSREATRKALSNRFSGTKVLVVDDEREILLLLEQILTGEGFQVLTASDGQEGLEIYLRERPPLVVSDAMLPRLHGFELCRRIKEESRQAAKIMILTAVYKKYKYKGKVQEEYGVDEYLDKPFQITEFLQTFYRMAETMSPERLEAPLEGRLTVGEPSETLSFILASAEDRDLASKVTAYCERHKYRHLRIEDPRKLIDTLRHQGPDILLLGESLPGLDTGLAAYIIRDLLEARWTTTVLVTRDRSRMEKHMDGVDHKVAAPIDNSVLDNIVSLHLSARGPEDQRRQQTRSLEDRRVDALLRSKVDRILKSHNQLEEYYSTRVRETEAEIQRQRTAREEEAGRMRDEFNEETGRLRQELEERSARISELEKEVRHLRDLLSEGSDVGE